MRGMSPRLSFISFGSAAAYFLPCGDSSASPPILPETLYSDSPCLVKKMARGVRCKFMRTEWKIGGGTYVKGEECGSVEVFDRVTVKCRLFRLLMP